MEIKRTTLIQSDLFHISNVGTSEQVQDLLKQIREGKDEISNSNDGCWRSNRTYTNIDWLLQTVAKLAGNAIEYYSNLDPMYKNTSKQVKMYYWTNVNQPNSRNTMHTHTAYHFTCVYYVQGKDTGALRIINPANVLSNCEMSAPFIKDIYFEPKDGDLILWPSWMPHEVEPNFSNKERINLAFEITI